MGPDRVAPPKSLTTALSRSRISVDALSAHDPGAFSRSGGLNINNRAAKAKSSTVRIPDALEGEIPLQSFSSTASSNVSRATG